MDLKSQSKVVKNFVLIMYIYGYKNIGNIRNYTRITEGEL